MLRTGGITDEFIRSIIHESSSRNIESIINFQDQNITSSSPTPSDILNNLRRVEVDENQDTTQCSICFEQVSGTCVKLRCNHIFHENCIVRWLERHNNCPMCRLVVDERLNNTNSTQQNASEPQHVSLVQRIHMMPITTSLDTSNQYKHIHFVYNNGVQTDTIWPSYTKMHQLLDYVDKSSHVNGYNIKITFNVGDTTVYFTSADSYATLNRTLTNYMISDHCIMRVTNNTI